MSMLFKRIKDWAVSITSFRTGDVIAVDGPNGTAKMSKDDLLKETAENALVDNLAPEFDPTRTENNPYIAYKNSCVYEGELYECITNHYGPWVAEHFARTNGDTLFAKTRDVTMLENDKVDKSIIRCGNDYYRVIKSSGVVASLVKNKDLTFVWTFTKGNSVYSASTIRIDSSSIFLTNKYRLIFENLGSEIVNADVLLTGPNGEWSTSIAIGKINISINERNFLNIDYEESYRSVIESYNSINLTLRVQGEGNAEEKTLKFCVEKVEEKYFADVQTSNYAKDSFLLGGKSPAYYAKADDVIDKEYIDSIAKEYCQSIDPLTDKNLFPENEQTQSGNVIVRSWNDSLKPYTFSVDASKTYYVVLDVLVKNNSGTTIGRFFLESSGFCIRNSSGTILERALFYNENSKRWVSSTISSFKTNIENGGEAIFRMLLKFDPSSYESTSLYWTVSLNRFAESSGSSTYITSGVSVKGINSWVFANDGQDTEEILRLTGKLFQSSSFIVKESLVSETASKLLSKFNKKKLVTYGDSITANGGWQDYIRKYLNLNSVVNKGIGGTFVCQKNGSSSAFCSISRIETVDSDADAVIIMGGTNDAGQGYEIGDLTYDNGFDVTKFKGALATTVRLMQSQCPNADIFVASPLGGRGTAGQTEDMPVYANGLTTYDYAKACKEVAEFFCIPYIPIFEECFINPWNRTKYIADSVHPNNAGKKRIAEVMIKYLCLWQHIES